MGFCDVQDLGRMGFSSPLHSIAKATQGWLDLSPPLLADLPFSRVMRAGTAMVERSTRVFEKPSFRLDETIYRGQTLTVKESIALQKPFCNLLHFKRMAATSALQREIDKQPKVLIAAPMSGHHATLLRGTVEAMLPNHDVYITDWIDAKHVPLRDGKFDLGTYVDYMRDIFRHLGRDTHVIAVCQPCVPVLAAVALMAEANEAAQPRSMVLMGGPVDARANPTSVSEFGKNTPLDSLKALCVHKASYSQEGAGRMVYPAAIQLQSFMAMNLRRHIQSHVDLFSSLVMGDDDSADKKKAFYDEYMAVMDMPAEFYLQTVQRVFKDFDLAHGTFWHDNKLVRPEAIHKTALMVVEGEKDDISAPGQTAAALDLCWGLAAHKKLHHIEPDAGHYGIFNGSKWRKNIQPKIAGFIRENMADDKPFKARYFLGNKQEKPNKPSPRS